MGWLTLPKPGSEYGPCVEPCVHRDCAATRNDAGKICEHCGQKIGFDVPYYSTEGGKIVHAKCAGLAAAQKRKED